MINYKISYIKPHRHFVDFQITASTNGMSKMLFQLASWRPGRYELANFSQNIRSWHAFDKYGNSLNFKKLNKDLWEVDTLEIDTIIVSYSFYSNQLDAGSCYLDEHQLYLNPVHCFFYICGRIDEKYCLNFDIPHNYEIASSLTRKNNSLIACSYDDLAESPIICSDKLQNNNYIINGIKFHLWFQGECEIYWDKLLTDFEAFTKSQIDHFGGFPVDEYHFFFQITPYRSYHGVEHTKNTVLLLGPGNEIMNSRYNDLLGLCSHELYHTWNIKSIRPKEMLPYDYTKENYFRTGFVAEGVTTYMGDLMLYKSGVFNWGDFVKTQNQNLERHLMNYGRFNLSVADSGFDNWLDGYKIGAPNRKVSIYPDGALCMLMVDLQIIKYSNGKFSLNSVMKDLYNNFALKGKGYSELDFKQLCIHYGGSKVEEIFDNHIYGVQDYIPSLRDSLENVGIELKEKKNTNLSAQYFGLVTANESGKIIVKKVEPDSEADKKGVGPEDEILKINGEDLIDDLNKVLMKEMDKAIFVVKKKFSELEITLSLGNNYKLLVFDKNNKPSEDQLLLRNKWLRL
tara:strand:- start:4238 stop:5944 length:1707 start_codon:yes stop_codon:yes gene_type:complete